MTTKHFVAVVFVTAVVFSGCKKEGPFSGDGGPMTNPVRAIIEQDRADVEQSTVINAASGGVMVGTSGTVITFQPNAFRTNTGGMVSGPVTVRMLEAMNPGDMVKLNMQTVALYGNNTKGLLMSGGEVRVRAEAGGEQVTVQEGAVMIHMAAPEPDFAMQRFIGEEDADGDVLWRQDGELDVDSAVVIPDTMGGFWEIPGNFYTVPWPPNVYNTEWPDYGYINCDHPLPPGGDSTDVGITVPEGFGGWTGSSVWIIVPDMNCMVYMEGWNGNTVNAGFPLRIGMQGTIVAFANHNGTYYSSFTPITITDDHQQSITLQTTTLDAYHLALDAL